ncbi:EAL domain-containing protein [Pseudomonas putida]|jgi:diguanylate cyclase (GGDEF)-like protein/PAS domain S-box-containing protein|uniref:EAL domain-containing protein n=2 Tax=Pseudomonas TaxID=286 RepID=A0ABD7BAR9_PSEPU|nr:MULTISPECIES: EAL domain-containing protein [Pseudomonas]PNB62729.1 bifunctional diguanylate cyclase/phosphodiesterase [Pseudomonas sp. FW305-130]MBH3451045.1 EAL domain-containing protein [Pseudomonas putida]PNB01414.1 bifunctional diguanylate cyclase/phosphodiesterase [Pseudomonas sp. GW460-5]QOC96984.1 EAL domain-containing protein [Pseudomonas putida]WAP62624.1 EAL domain-containing protein [Pseudomonas putida]
MARTANLPPASPTPRFQVRHLIAGFSTVYGLACLVILGALFNIATTLDKQERQRSAFHATQALEQRLLASRQFLSSYAVWDAAFEHLAGHADWHWAYEEKNVGESLYSASGYEGVFVVENDRTTYALFKGQPTQAGANTYIDATLQPILDQARAAAIPREQITRFVLFNGWPAVLSAAAIRPDRDVTDSEVSQAPVMLFVDQLTEEKLAQLGKGAGLTRMHVEKEDMQQHDHLRIDLGDTGYHLSWSSPLPGHQLLWAVMPALLSALLILGLIMLYLFRLTLRSSRAIGLTLSHLQQSNQALEASEQRFRAVAESASDWIWETDRQQRLTYLSQRFANVTGYAVDDWLGHPLNQLLACDTTPLSPWLDALANADPEQLANLRCTYRDQNGQNRYCRISARAIWHDDTPIGFRGTASDITDEVDAHARIQHLSLHDPLTGLANRNKLARHLEQALLRGNDSPPLSLLLLDLDNFKPINDSLGHAAGDAVLQEVATRLRDTTRDGDLVARLGGDEFILVLSGMDNRSEVDRFCARLIDLLQHPITFDSQLLHVGVSIGVAQTRTQGFDAGELIRCADIALYQAKADGKNTWRYFAAEMNQQIQYRRQLENDLRRALRNQEFELHYQPRYRLSDRRIVAVEALLRWQHPQEGLLGPDTFIPLAEQSDIIVALGRWVLREACRTAHDWPADILVSVNLSPAQFLRSDVVADVREVLLDTSFPAQRLELEITENVMLNDIEGALGTMLSLKELGVRLNMDDFGTGYSSLGYLRTYPFDSIKIDKRFINGLNSSGGRDRAVVQAIINLGEAMGLTVTAEGVESEQQLKALEKDRCHEVQGFYMSRPLDSAGVAALLHQTSHSTAKPL